MRLLIFKLPENDYLAGLRCCDISDNDDDVFRSICEGAMSASYGRPLSVSGRPCYILPMFYLFFNLFFMAALFSGPGERRFAKVLHVVDLECMSLKKLLLGFFPGHP